jgi:hypothetical protein
MNTTCRNHCQKISFCISILHRKKSEYWPGARNLSLLTNNPAYMCNINMCILGLNVDSGRAEGVAKVTHTAVHCFFFSGLHFTALRNSNKWNLILHIEFIEDPIIMLTKMIITLTKTLGRSIESIQINLNQTPWTLKLNWFVIQYQSLFFTNKIQNQFKSLELQSWILRVRLVGFQIH